MAVSSADAALLDMDLYLLLDPTRTLTSASPPTDISRCYRIQARLLHPDKRPEADKAEAAVEFDRLQRAYELLLDEDRRRLYDDRWRAKEERKRRRTTEDESIRRMRQRLHEREAEAQAKSHPLPHSSQPTPHPTAHTSHTTPHQRSIQRENERIIEQLREAALRRSSPPPLPSPPLPTPPSSSFSSTVNLSLLQSIEDAALRSHFTRYGRVEHVHVMHSKAKAFVTFYDPTAAKAATQAEQSEHRRWRVVSKGDPTDSSTQWGRDERKEGPAHSERPVVNVVELKAYEAVTLAKLRALARKKKGEGEGVVVEEVKASPIIVLDSGDDDVSVVSPPGARPLAGVS